MKIILIILFFLSGIINAPLLKDYNSIGKGLIFLLLFIIYLKNIKNFNFLKSNFIKKWLINIFLFNCFILLMEIVKGNYLNSNYFYPINLATFFLLCGYLIKENMYKYFKIYNFSIFFLSLDLFFKYFKKIDYSKTQYLVNEKNSLGPMITISIISIIFGILFRNESKKWILVCIFNMFILFSLKNRTGIVSLSFVILYLIIKKYSIREILKYFLLPFSFIIIIFHKKIYNYINWSLNLSHSISKTATKLESLTSGRTTLYLKGIKQLLEDFFLGTGSYYVDNLFLNFSINYGIVGLIFILIFFRILSKIFKVTEQRNLFIRSLLILVLFPSLLEAMHPFGPGLSYFIFWFVLGNFLRRLQLLKKERGRSVLQSL